MTQSATQRRHADPLKGGPETGPSTPVIITGGGSGNGTETDVIPSISFTTMSEQDAPPVPLLFHTDPIEQTLWRQSLSGLPILLTDVVLSGTFIHLEPDQHPATITFEAGGLPSFQLIEVGNDNGKYRVLLNVIGQTKFDVTERSGDGWVRATSYALNSFDRVVVMGEGYPLDPGYSVEILFQE